MRYINIDFDSNLTNDLSSNEPHTVIIPPWWKYIILSCKYNVECNQEILRQGFPSFLILACSEPRGGTIKKIRDKQLSIM